MLFGLIWRAGSAASACRSHRAKRVGAALLLVGGMIGSGCSAIVSLILTLADQRQSRGMVFWLLGDLNGAAHWEIAWLALAVALVDRRADRPSADWLVRGDAWAATLGVPVARRRC